MGRDTVQMPDHEALRDLALESVCVAGRWRLLEECKVSDLLTVVAQECNAASSALRKGMTMCELAAVAIDPTCEREDSLRMLRMRDKLAAPAGVLSANSDAIDRKVRAHDPLRPGRRMSTPAGPRGG
jgi:hypothetical protein